MVTITNGIVTADVSNGAFESIFKAQGYRIVGGDAHIDTGVDNNHEPDENGEFLAHMKEKPLSQWSKDEIRKYAAIKGIDISGTKNPNEAKQIIRIYMQDHPND